MPQTCQTMTHLSLIYASRMAGAWLWHEPRKHELVTCLNQLVGEQIPELTCTAHRREWHCSPRTAPQSGEGPGGGGGSPSSTPPSRTSVSALGRGGGGARDALEGAPSLRQLPASMAFVTDSNCPQPLWQLPPTTCLTTSGAASEIPCLLMHPCGGGGGFTRATELLCWVLVTTLVEPAKFTLSAHPERPKQCLCATTTQSGCCVSVRPPPHNVLHVENKGPFDKFSCFHV